MQARGGGASIVGVARISRSGTLGLCAGWWDLILRASRMFAFYMGSGSSLDLSIQRQCCAPLSPWCFTLCGCWDHWMKSVHCEKMSHFLDPTSDGGVGEWWLRRRALESNGLGSDPDFMALGQWGQWGPLCCSELFTYKRELRIMPVVSHSWGKWTRSCMTVPSQCLAVGQHSARA